MENETLEFQCSHCKATVEGDYSDAGSTMPCPACGLFVTVPGSPPPRAASAVPQQVILTGINIPFWDLVSLIWNIFWASVFVSMLPALLIWFLICASRNN